MAKGENTTLYPGPEVPSNIETVPEALAWVQRELMEISAVFNAALARQVEFLNVAPGKPREGMVRGADGVNWNPGAGKGVYAYYTGAWHLLG